jgi:hypothetical protein
LKVKSKKVKDIAIQVIVLVELNRIQ